MANGLLDKRNDYLSISDYISAYDDGIAFDEVEVISTPFITYIESGFFQQFKNLKHVNLPNLRSLPSQAFRYCSTIETITLPKISIIDSPGMFFACHELRELNLSSDIIIGSHAYSAFAYCYKLSNISTVICDSQLPSSIFTYCKSLKTIYIKGSCSSIGPNAFEGCINLTNFNTENDITYIDIGGFSGCSNLYQINSNVNLSYIANYTFWGCRKLTNINEIIKSVSYIGLSAFAECSNLRNLKINGDISINNLAFDRCDNLSKIEASELTVLKGLPYVKDHDFRNIKTVNEILINQYFDPIIDLSTVETVNTGSKGLSVFEVISLPNCTSMNFTSYNIDGRITREFIMPELFLGSESISSLYLGFGGYKEIGPNIDQWYTSIVTSKIIAPKIDYRFFFNSYNFPLSSTRVFPSSLTLLYSCVEELYIQKFSNFIYNQIPNSDACLINLLSNLTTLTADTFEIYQSPEEFQFSQIENMHMTNVPVIGELSEDHDPHVVIYDQLHDMGRDKIVNMYFYSADTALFEYEPYDYSINDYMRLNLYFSDITSECGVWYSAVPGVPLAGLPNISFKNIGELKGDFTIKNEEKSINLYLNDVLHISWLNIYNTSLNSCYGIKDIFANETTQIKWLSIYGNDVHAIDNVHLNGLDPFSKTSLPDVSIHMEYVKNVYMNALTKIDYSAADANHHQVYEFSKVENLMLSNCSYINLRGSAFNVKSIYAPKCNYINITGSSSIANLELEHFSLSRYVDYFAFAYCDAISNITFNTLSAYSFSQAPITGCKNLNTIQLTASSDIIFTQGIFSALNYLDSRIHNPNCNILLEAYGSVLRYNMYPSTPEYGYMNLSCPNGLVSVSQFMPYNFTSIYAKSISICDLQLSGNILLLLDTSDKMLSNPFSSYYGISGNAIIKVRQSLLSYYTESSYWQQFSSYLQFLPI